MEIARRLPPWLAACVPPAGMFTFLLAFGPLYSVLHLPKKWDGAVEGALWGVVLLTPLFAWAVLASLKRKKSHLHTRQILASLQWGFILSYPALALFLWVVISISKR